MDSQKGKDRLVVFFLFFFLRKHNILHAIIFLTHLGH